MKLPYYMSATSLARLKAMAVEEGEEQMSIARQPGRSGSSVPQVCQIHRTHSLPIAEAGDELGHGRSRSMKMMYDGVDLDRTKWFDPRTGAARSSAWRTARDSRWACRCRHDQECQEDDGHDDGEVGSVPLLLPRERRTDICWSVELGHDGGEDERSDIPMPRSAMSLT